jgi:hypothetical protein
MQYQWRQTAETLMPNTCFDPADFFVPACADDGQTVKLALELHPGQSRLLEHILTHTPIPFHTYSEVIRWCICWGVETLMTRPLPNSAALIEAKMNMLRHEGLERQKECLDVSVQKYLATGNIECARKLLVQSYEEYSRIRSEYWRQVWLSTLEDAAEMLRYHGVRLNLSKGKG